MQPVEIKTIKNGSSEVHFLLIGRKWENREVSLPTPSLNLDKLEKSPSLDSRRTLLDLFQKFQPNSLHSWGILASETASRTELHSLHPNPSSGQGTAMPVPVKEDNKIGESIALSGERLWDCDPATSVRVLPPAGCHCQVEQP